MPQFRFVSQMLDVAYLQGAWGGEVRSKGEDVKSILLCQQPPITTLYYPAYLFPLLP